MEGSERKVKGRGGEVARVHHFGCSETMSGAAEVRHLSNEGASPGPGPQTIVGCVMSSLEALLCPAM